MAYARTARRPFVDQMESYQSGSSGQDGLVLNNSVIQAKLMVGGADTLAEREANRVAQQIFSGPSRLHELDGAMGQGDAGGGELVQRSMEDAEGGEAFSMDAGMGDAMDASAYGAIDREAADEIGGKLGADFSDVRIHTDRNAEQVASGMSARAFTKGRDIYFNHGQYRPETAAGKELLAHELTHTIQQGKVAQSGGIPVSQSVGEGAAQRGFINVRKHFRKAVDERNRYYENFKKQSRWTRFKWAAKNPLAWMFGRTDRNKGKTAERMAREKQLESLDPDLDFPDENTLENQANGSLIGFLNENNEFSYRGGEEAENPYADLEDSEEETENPYADLKDPEEETDNPYAESELSEEAGENSYADLALPEEARENPYADLEVTEAMESKTPETATAQASAFGSGGSLVGLMENGTRNQNPGVSAFESARMEALADTLGREEAKTETPGQRQYREVGENIDAAMPYLSAAGLIVGLGGGSVGRTLGAWNEAGGLGETVGDISSKMQDYGGSGSGAVNWLGEKAQAANGLMTDNVTRGAQIAGGALGLVRGASMVSDAFAAKHEFDDTHEFADSGDYLAAGSHALDAAGNVISFGKNALGVVQAGLEIGGATTAAGILGNLAPGLNLAIGGAQMGASGLELARTGKVRHRTSKAKKGYEERLARATAAELKNEEEGRLSEEEKNRLKEQIGFMRMGHNTAKAEQARAGVKFAGGALKVASAGATLAGQSGVGMALTGAGAVTELAGGMIVDRKQRGWRNDELNETFDLDEKVKQLQARSKAADKKKPKSERLNLTESEARHMILKKMGYVNRQQAYIDLAKKRRNMLNDLPEEESAEMVHSLGLDPKKATDKVIYRRLGLSGADAANIDRALINQTKKKKLPSWLL